MNAVDLKELKEAAEKATPGPWRDYEHAEKPGEIQIGAGAINEHGDGWDEWCVATAWGGMGELRANARLIALANPSTILSLIERVTRAEEALTGAKERFAQIECAGYSQNVQSQSELAEYRAALASSGFKETSKALTQAPASNPMGSGE